MESMCKLASALLLVIILLSSVLGCNKTPDILYPPSTLPYPLEKDEEWKQSLTQHLYLTYQENDEIAWFRDFGRFRPDFRTTETVVAILDQLGEEIPHPEEIAEFLDFFWDE